MRLRDLILHNFRLKMFALLMAVLLWETIHLATRRVSEQPPLPSHTRPNRPANNP